MAGSEAPVVLVTGCSSGIGRATAGLLSGAGYTVVATARKPELLGELGAALTLALDVADEASVEAALREATARFGRIDVLVNNAGYAIRAAVEELDLAELDRLLDVNVKGILRLVRGVLPAMRERGSGRIVNIGSIAGRLSTPANGAYSASKFAVEALSDSLRWELEPFGIGVILVEPGNIATNFADRALRGSEHALKERDSAYAPLYAAYLRASVALRRREPGPEAVARVVLKALRAARPRARYRAAVPLSTRIAVALPDRGRDFLMRRLYGPGPDRRS